MSLVAVPDVNRLVATTPELEPLPISVTRLACLVMGTNDLAKETRARHVAGRAPMMPVLKQVLAAARAYGEKSIWKVSLSPQPACSSQAMTVAESAVVAASVTS